MKTELGFVQALQKGSLHLTLTQRELAWLICISTAGCYSSKSGKDVSAANGERIGVVLDAYKCANVHAHTSLELDRCSMFTMCA